MLEMSRVFSTAHLLDLDQRLYWVWKFKIFLIFCVCKKLEWLSLDWTSKCLRMYLFCYFLCITQHFSFLFKCHLCFFMLMEKCTKFTSQWLFPQEFRAKKKCDRLLAWLNPVSNQTFIVLLCIMYNLFIRHLPLKHLLFLHSGWKMQPQDRGIWPDRKVQLFVSLHPTKQRKGLCQHSTYTCSSLTTFAAGC